MPMQSFWNEIDHSVHQYTINGKAMEMRFLYHLTWAEMIALLDGLFR